MKSYAERLRAVNRHMLAATSRDDRWQDRDSYIVRAFMRHLDRGGSLVEWNARHA